MSAHIYSLKESSLYRRTESIIETAAESDTIGKFLWFPLPAIYIVLFGVDFSLITQVPSGMPTKPNFLLYQKCFSRKLNYICQNRYILPKID